MRKYIVIFLLGFLMVGCTSNTIEKFVDSVPYPESTEVLYKEEIENGTIIFYKDESGFRHAFVSDKLKSLNNSRNLELNPQDGFAWTMMNIYNIPMVTFAGVMTK